MARTDLSRPVALALQDGVLQSEHTFFDYGCGRGGDVRRLAARGFRAGGWDPVHAPASPRENADVVNLGFVLNVIQEPDERLRAVREAWSLAGRALVVAARPDWEARGLVARPHGDGWITSKGTFQKFYRQNELQAWLEGSLGCTAFAAAPGVFYVFRREQDAQLFRARQVRGPLLRSGVVPSELPAEDRAALQELVDFVLRRGRLPGADELEHGPVLIEAFSSVRRAALAAGESLNRHGGAAAVRARQDLQVYLALATFAGRPRWSSLASELQRDVRHLFGSYRKANAAADELLQSAGQQHELDRALATSQVGKRLPDALYVHVSSLRSLDPVLRVYEGCARVLVGHVQSASIIKLQRVERRVAYLAYPFFDRDPHPALQFSLRVDLRSFDVKFRDFSESENPPVLHRKETFVADDYPKRATFARLTKQEERADLLGGNDIGTRQGWLRALAASGRGLRGHRLVQVTGQDLALPDVCECVAEKTRTGIQVVLECQTSRSPSR